MVRCLECEHMHQQDRTKERFFCINARDYIDHEIDEKTKCKGYEQLRVRAHR